MQFRLDHVGITVVPDRFRETIHWYTSKLDFIIETEFEVGGTAFAFLTGGGVKVEIIAGAERHEGEHPVQVTDSLAEERLQHFCLAVDDLDETLTKLRARDVHPLGDAETIDTITQRIAFIIDNVGTVIELTEPGTWPADEQRRGAEMVS